MEHITLLLQKYIHNEISESERQHLLDALMYDEYPEEELLQWLSEQANHHPEDVNYSPERWQEMLTHIYASDRKKASVRPLFIRRFVAAASILILVAIGIYFWKTSVSSVVPASVSSVVSPSSHNSNTITLTLSDGTQLHLDSLGNGTIARQGNAQIILNKGQLSYNNTSSSDHQFWNTIQTPRGRQFQLVLPDGSKVWLNAESSVKYPVSFDKERNVEVTGEVYFEVAQDKTKPFYVKGDDATVEVLGTSFNMNVYENESVKKITLLEGKVRVSVFKEISPAAKSNVLSDMQTTGRGSRNDDPPGGLDVRNEDHTVATGYGLGVWNDDEIRRPFGLGDVARPASSFRPERQDDSKFSTHLPPRREKSPANAEPHSVILTPNQQAQFSAISEIRKIGVISGSDIAWKRGFFSFQNASLQEVMKQLERWYDLEVIYQGKIPDLVFEGKIRRSQSLENVISILEKIKSSFSYEGESTHCNAISVLG